MDENWLLLYITDETYDEIEFFFFFMIVVFR